MCAGDLLPWVEEALHRTSFYKDSSWVLLPPYFWGVVRWPLQGGAHRAVQLEFLAGAIAFSKGPHLSVHQ